MVLSKVQISQYYRVGGQILNWGVTAVQHFEVGHCSALQEWHSFYNLAGTLRHLNYKHMLLQ